MNENKQWYCEFGSAWRAPFAGTANIAIHRSNRGSYRAQQRNADKLRRAKRTH